MCLYTSLPLLTGGLTVDIALPWFQRRLRPSVRWWPRWPLWPRLCTLLSLSSFAFSTVVLLAVLRNSLPFLFVFYHTREQAWQCQIFVNLRNELLPMAFKCRTCLHYMLNRILPFVAGDASRGGSLIYYLDIATKAAMSSQYLHYLKSLNHIIPFLIRSNILPPPPYSWYLSFA